MFSYLNLTISFFILINLILINYPFKFKLRWIQIVFICYILFALIFDFVEFNSLKITELSSLSPIHLDVKNLMREIFADRFLTLLLIMILSYQLLEKYSNPLIALLNLFMNTVLLILILFFIMNYLTFDFTGNNGITLVNDLEGLIQWLYYVGIGFTFIKLSILSFAKKEDNL